mmetsp:Transcript_25311/g.41643  ORF Transcript_25311/g.41643 Transcript_25311/m.41643 type:complete len:166 (-) Transcript_25311:57-554(-)
MRLALDEARKAFANREVPVGAVIVNAGGVIASTHNEVEGRHDPTAHAEVLAIRHAANVLQNWRLTGATLYCTMEPCAMCLGAILLSRIDRIVWAAPDLRHGANGGWVDLLGNGSPPHPTHPSIQVSSGVLKDESANLIRSFFRERRLQGPDKSEQSQDAIQEVDC